MMIFLTQWVEQKLFRMEKVGSESIDEFYGVYCLAPYTIVAFLKDIKT